MLDFDWISDEDNFKKVLIMYLGLKAQTIDLDYLTNYIFIIASQL